MDMTFYVFDVRNRWTEKQFYCKAEDLISAHMKAMEFAKLLEQKIKYRFSEDLPTTVTAIGEWPVCSMTDDAGVENYLEELTDYIGVED